VVRFSANVNRMRGNRADSLVNLTLILQRILKDVLLETQFCRLQVLTKKKLILLKSECCKGSENELKL